ncbi:hypothetical protein [Castellaniella caeni]|uniref:hypothetical protein n=1 Tax=Castellaniella caeni TaxID=266123 RepID=UPI000829BE9C|nr:hypothetical protein [Castellaniella caeni]
MPIPTTAYYGAALLLTALLSGCGSAPERTSAVHRDTQCRLAPSSCQYNGAYEPGERDYAEEEARRLNQAQTAKLKRGGLW